MRCNTASRLSFAVVVAMTTLLSVPKDAHAGAIYSASTSDGPSTGGSSPVSSYGNAYSDANGQSLTNNEAAVTSVGSVGADISQIYNCLACYPTSPTSLSVPTATAAASFTVDDVIFGTIGGGSITTSLNLHLNGFINPVPLIFDPTMTTLSDSTTIEITVDIKQGANFYSTSGSSSESVTRTGPYGASVTTAVSSSGLLANFLTPDPDPEFAFELQSNSDLTTGAFTVTAGIPVTVSIGFSANNKITGTIDTGAFADEVGTDTEFLHTLSFATDVPVFNLAAGDIVNSVEGNIVNNQYVAVAEPSTILLFGTALVSLCGFVRWREGSLSLL